jgi:hypothetical protein
VYVEVAAPAGRLRNTPTASCDDEPLLRVTGAVPTVKAEVAPRVGNEQMWCGSLREKSDALERGRPPRGPRTRRARLRGLPVLPLVPSTLSSHHLRGAGDRLVIARQGITRMEDRCNSLESDLPKGRVVARERVTEGESSRAIAW